MDDSSNPITETLAESAGLLRAMAADHELAAQIQRATALCIDALRAGGRVLIAGNGGSAADAQHFAAELVSRFYYDRPGLAAIALTTDTSALTAIGNDYGFERVFSRQVEALGRHGDVFIGISTSGQSANVLAAFARARELGMVTIGLCGNRGGPMASLCDCLLAVPAAVTPRIQEGMLVVEHIICERIEATLFPRPDA